MKYSSRAFKAEQIVKKIKQDISSDNYKRWKFVLSENDCDEQNKYNYVVFNCGVDK